MQELEQQIIQWANDKGIFDKSSPQSQMSKTLEEAEELLVEVEAGNNKKAKMELGDVLVTLVIQAYFQRSSLKECLQLAYEKISKRTGKMIDGKFVKD